MGVGIRRVSAFLKIALSTSIDHVPDNFSLGRNIVFQFGGTDLPAEKKEEVLETYVRWVSGCCLKELDLHFAIFLDVVWRIAEVGELNGAIVKAGYDIDRRFERDTNARSKLDKLARRLKAEAWSDCFESLSKARNALAHGPGRARRKDCDPNTKKFKIVWKAPEVVIEDGDERVTLNDDSTLPYTTKSDSKFVMRIVDHFAEFDRGEPIHLSESQLGEICAFYMQQAVIIVEALEAHLRGKGVTVNARA